VDMVNYMVEKNMTNFLEISKIVVAYYQYPEETAKRIRAEMGWVRERPAQAEQLPGGEGLGQ